MKFFRLFKFDIKNGTIRNVFIFVLPVLIAFMSMISLFINGKSIEQSISFGDSIINLYGGMKEYIPTPGNRFNIPILWLTVFLINAFLVLNYPIRDMEGIGSQILVKSCGRSKWWISKCLWNMFSSIFYHALIIGTLFITGMILNISLTLILNTKMISYKFIIFENEFLGIGKIPLSVILAPIIFSISLNLLQMFLSLFIKPVFGYLIICILMISSAYLLHPFMIGNYAMQIRYTWAKQGGVSHYNGIIISIIIAFVVLVIGVMRFKKYDIL